MIKRIPILLAALPLIASAEPEVPMIGRQSHNEGIRAVPAPGTVKIDGKLDDWDFSGRIWSFADVAIRDRYSSETAMMWDKDFLYIGQKVLDPNPLVNTIDPTFDPQGGWKGDSLQLRVLTDWPSWVTLWKHTGSGKSILHRASWGSEDSSKGIEDTFFISEPNSTQLGKGIEMASVPNEDGYVREIRIPWQVIYKSAPDISPGLTIRIGLELFWGRPGESTRPAHRYTDNLQKGETSREFFWSAKRAWGDVTLLPEGNVEEHSYILPGQKLVGTIPLELEIPADAKEFTVVIEKDGKRIRNLGAQLEPARYKTSEKDGILTVEVLWDGADDHEKMVSPGTYTSRGLTHRGLGADYVMSFYNPGTPPWDTGGKGGWGADHSAPKLTAASGDWSIVAWSFAEGGHGVIGVGPDGLKKWGEKRGASTLAADEKHVYFTANSWHAKGNFCRLEKTKGAYKPFILDGKERPFELPLTDIFGDEVPGNPTALASSGKTIAMALSGGKIALLEAESAKLTKLIDAPSPTALAYGPGETLYAVSGGKLVSVSDDMRSIPTPGIGEIGKTLTVDPDGNIGLLDIGTDQQIKFYSPEGKFSHALGKKGGRPVRGDFEEEAMSHASSIATNSKGETWVTESWDFPRRVSVWGKDGKLIRDYIGNTHYAATGTFLHDSDPTLAYFGPVEMKLDLEKRTWKVTRILWVPGEGEHFKINTGSHAHPHRFTSEAGGKQREFMFAPPYRRHNPYVLYMEGENGWRPVSAIGTLGQITGDLEKGGKVVSQPSGEYEGANAYDSYIWNDLDRDGKISRKEVTVVTNPKPVKIGKSGSSAIPMGSGWGTRMSPKDLSFFVNGLARYTPASYTDEGAPVFTTESIREYDNDMTGDFVPLISEDSVLALTNKGYFATTGLYALDTETGEPKWSYPNPYPRVHGSHRATMPQPGLLIGALKFLGTADIPGDKHHLFGIRGNLGQDFYYTSDGLFVGTVFQDTRLPSMPLPGSEADLVGSPMESMGGRGEPFSGWMGQHSDGKVRFTFGLAGQAAMICQMNGLDKIKRFTGPKIALDTALISKAALDNDARAAAERKGAEKKQDITRVSESPDWRKIPSFEIKSTASNFKGKAQLAYGQGNLYLAMEVEDPSPWKNEGIDPARLFKTGDAVDLQLGNETSDRSDPAAGDIRIVFAKMGKKPAAILMRPVSPGAPESSRKTYTSPVGNKKFDEVRQLETAEVRVETKGRGYRIEATIPFTDLGLRPEAGQEIRGDIGFISSDAAGRINTARTYWSNQATNLVNDEPIESWLNPSAWGSFTWGE